MKRILTTLGKAVLCLALGSLSMSAIAQERYMSPASLNYPGTQCMQYLWYIMPTWNYQQVSPTETGLSATISVNGADAVEIGAQNIWFESPEPPKSGGGPAYKPGTRSSTTSGTALYINLEPLYGFSLKGDIVINIPEGIVKNEAGEINPEQSFLFYIYPTNDNATLTPAPGEDTVLPADNETVSITWEGTTGITHNDLIKLSVMIEPHQISAPDKEPEQDSRYSLSFGKEVTISEDGNALLISFSSVPPGVYTLTVPEAYVILNGFETPQYNREIITEPERKQFYTVIQGSAGVEFLNPEEGMFKVFDLKGVNVLNTTDRNRIGELAPGIYIINGHKTIKR